MGIGFVVFALLAGLFVAGGWLLLRGLWGDRVERHVACRRCGFDLSRLEAEKCPECAAILVAAGAVRTVKRRRNLGRALWGSALMGVALAAPAVLLVDSLLSGRVSSALPTPVLSLELRVLGSRTPKSVSEELLTRCVNGNVDGSTLRVVAMTVCDMPGKAPDGSLPPSLNQLVGDAAPKGLISKDVLAKHIITPVLLEAEVPQRIRPDDPLVERLINASAGEGRIPLNGSWIIGRRLVGVELDGVRQQSRVARSQQEASSWCNAHTYASTVTTSVNTPGLVWQSVQVPVVEKKASGPHSVKLYFDVAVFSGPNDAAPGRTQASREYTVTVVPDDEPILELADDEAFKKQLASLLRPTVMHQQGTLSAGLSLMVTSGVPAPKLSRAAIRPGACIGGAWDLLIEIDGARIQAGKYKLGWRPNGEMFQSSWCVIPRLPSGATLCRVILVPDERYGARREAIDLMPAGEIVIEDVPIN